LHDYEDWWAISAQPHAPEFDYWAHLRTYYRALRARGVQVDIVHPETALDDYAAVVAPTLHLADDALASHLDGYVRDGGQLLLGARSGVKTRANQLHETLAPGPLADLAGVRVDQHESFPADVPLSVTVDGESYSASVWAEWLEPAADTTVLATHDTGPAADRPAITHTAAGAGSVTYCGVWPDADLADALVTDLLGDAGVATSSRLPTGVRLNERGDLTWVSNFTSDRYALGGVATDDVAVGDLPVDAFDAVAVSTPRPDITPERLDGGSS
jgi:beta-galactosidase